jgi:hypothetical protein
VALKGRISYKRTAVQLKRLRELNLGRKHTAESRANVRAALMGRAVSAETRHKLHLALMGRIVSVETRAKMSIAHKGKKLPSEQKAKIGASGRGRVVSAETRFKISKSSIGKLMSEDAKRKMSAKTRSQWCNPNYRTKVSVLHRSNWDNTHYRDRQIKAMRLGCHSHPNKPETSLLDLLNKTYPNEWKFVGDGSFVIGGKNPDYTNINGRKMFIELFGDYWHKGQNPQDRIDLFKQYGYDTLVIWERELKDEAKVLVRLSEFVCSQTKIVHSEE